MFEKSNLLTEEIHLCVVNSHKDANFTEIKSILQSLLKATFGIACETKTASHPIFTKGRVADITVNGKTVGIIGEINDFTREAFKIRQPIVSFEKKLSGLIFD